MKDKVQGTFLWVAKRVALLTLATTLVGLIICLVLGQWSAELFSDIQFVQGGLLFVIGLIDVSSTKIRMADYTYQFSRPAGQSSLEERTFNDLQEVNRSYSGLLLFSISGLLTIGMGLGIYRIFG